MEYQAFRTADRLLQAIASNRVIAWRIMVLTLLGRHVQNCEAGLVFSEDELGFLGAFGGRMLRGVPRQQFSLWHDRLIIGNFFAQNRPQGIHKSAKV